MSHSQINFPSESVPSIVVSAEFDSNLMNSIKMTADVAGQIFSINGRYHHNEIDLSVHTPYATMDELIVKGKLDSVSNEKMIGNLEVKYPSVLLNIMSKYDLSNGVSTDFSLKCVYHDMPTCSIDLSFLNQPGSDIKASIELESIYMQNPVSLKLSSGHKILDVNTNIFGASHGLYFEREIDLQSGIKSTIIASTPFLNGRHVINIESNVFDFKRGITKTFQTNLSISGKYTGSVAVVVNTNEGISSSVTVTTHQGTYTLETTFQNAGTDTNVTIKASCPKNTHELKLVIKQDIVSSSKKFITVEGVASSSLLPTNMEYSLKGELEGEKKMFDQTVKIGENVHHIRSGYSYSSIGGDMVVEIETPLFDIKKLSLSSDLKIRQNIRAVTKVTYLGADHSFDLRVNREEKKITAIISSPVITGEVFEIRGSMVGSTPSNMDFVGSIMFAEQSYVAKMALKFVSINNISSELEIKTPFRGYRKMNYVLSFKNDESIKAIFRADSPIDFKFEVESGKTTQSYKTLVNIETPVNGYEKITIAAEVPLNNTAAKVMIQLPHSEYALDFELENGQFSKHISGNVAINGANFGGGFGLRYKAPYEFGYFYNASETKGKFHLLMDSTMFQLLFPWA